MQHWLAHIGTIHTLQQGVTIAGCLGQAQYNIDILAPFSQLLDASIMQYSNLGEHYIYVYNATTLSSLLIQTESITAISL